MYKRQSINPSAKTQERTEPRKTRKADTTLCPLSNFPDQASISTFWRISIGLDVYVPVGAVGPPSLAICRACRGTLARSATTFDDAVPAPSCCALAEKDSCPSPPLPSPPGGVCYLSPDGGFASALLMSAQKRAGTRSIDASVWSRLVRMAPRWWCRCRKTRGVIAGER